MRAVIALFGMAILAFAAVFIFQGALASAGDTVTVTNETWTPDAGNFTVLNDSNRDGAYYDDTVTVFDENDTEIQRKSDYEWNDSDGTVKAVTGGDLDGDASANITYSYDLATDEQQQIAGMLNVIPESVGLLLPAFLGIIFLVFLRG